VRRSLRFGQLEEYRMNVVVFRKVMTVTGNAIQAGLHSLPVEEGSSMNATCLKCGMNLDAAWTFCPHCAEPCRHTTEAVPRKHEAAPVAGGFSGLLFGLIAAPVLVISGGMICLTGLGIFLGVPLIILGVLSPLLGPVLGLNQQRGHCPWCSAQIGSVALFDRFCCPSCSKRIVVCKEELLRAE